MKGKALVIVESPSKAKTIGKILGSRYKVIARWDMCGIFRRANWASISNIISSLSIFRSAARGDVIKMLKKEAKAASKVYLATDPDREGEAISWHISHLLGIDDDAGLPCGIQ